jgi:hypothetical protein
MQLLIFPTLVGLSCNDFSIKLTFCKFLQFKEVFGDLFVVKQNRFM